MITFLLFAMLFMHSAFASESAVGQSYYLPLHNLNGELLLGGANVFENIPPSCIGTTKVHQSDSDTSFRKDTESFYQSLSTENSLSGELKNDFTLGFTLDVTTQSVSGSTRTVKGSTLFYFAIESTDYLQQSCTDKQMLNPNLTAAFEKLPAVITYPEHSSNWSDHEVFLNRFGSHMVKKVDYGSSIYQHTFSDSSTSYSQKDFQVKACADLTVPTEGGLLNTKACTGISQKDIDQVSNMESSSKFVARGGTKETRAKLMKERTNELIEKFMTESVNTHEPVRYKFTPIWTLLKAAYLGTEHFSKAMTLEAFYKGYLNYGCSYQEDRVKNVVLRKFSHSPYSTDKKPMYECILPPDGCHSENDCHYRFGPWCECKGDTCVKYKDTKLDTGVMKTTAVVNREHDYDGPGCRLDYSSVWTTCTCSKENHKYRVEWTSEGEQAEFAYMSHLKVLNAGSGKNRFEL